MSKGKMLILGGATGFIGQNMTQYFMNDWNVHVTIRDLRHSMYDDIRAEPYYNVDLCKPGDVDALFVSVKPDIVLQFAASTTGSKDVCLNPAVHVTDNAVMNSYIFRAAVENGVKHVVFPSCTTMYNNSDVPLKEEDVTEIPEKYFGVAHTKMYLEKMAKFYSGLGETQFTVMRHSNVYGPLDKFDLERSHVTGATITKVMTAPRRGEIVVWGNGEEERDLLYVTDLCEFVDKVLHTERSRNYELFNVGSSREYSVNDIVDMVIHIAGRDDLTKKYDTSKPTIPVSFGLNCHKALFETGWSAKTTLAQGISQTIDWYRQEYSPLGL